MECCACQKWTYIGIVIVSCRVLPAIFHALHAQHAVRWYDGQYDWQDDLPWRTTWCVTWRARCAPRQSKTTYNRNRRHNTTCNMIHLIWLNDHIWFIWPTNFTAQTRPLCIYLQLQILSLAQCADPLSLSIIWTRMLLVTFNFAYISIIDGELNAYLV
jgi:hypothetical protein